MIDLLPLVVHSPSSPTEWAHPSKSSCYPSEVFLSAVSGRHVTAVSSSPTSVSLSGGRFVLLQTKTKTCSMLYAQYLCCTSCVYYVDARVPNTVIGPFGEQRIISRMLKRLICLWPWCWSCMMLLALHPRRCVLLLAHADGRAAEVGSVLCQWRCVCMCVCVWERSVCETRATGEFLSCRRLLLSAFVLDQSAPRAVVQQKCWRWLLVEISSLWVNSALRFWSKNTEN